MNRGYGYGAQPMTVRPPSVQPQWGKGGPPGAASGWAASSSASGTVRLNPATGSKGGTGAAAGGSAAGGGIWNPAWGKGGAAPAQNGGASAGGKGMGWGGG